MMVDDATMGRKVEGCRHDGNLLSTREWSTPACQTDLPPHTSPNLTSTPIHKSQTPAPPGGKSVDHIVQTPELRRLASLVMLDVIKAANAELAIAAANDAAGARAAFADLHDDEEVGREGDAGCCYASTGWIRLND